MCSFKRSFDFTDLAEFTLCAVIAFLLSVIFFCLVKARTCSFAEYVLDCEGKDDATIRPFYFKRFAVGEAALEIGVGLAAMIPIDGDIACTGA